MNINKMINTILLKISQEHSVFYMEKRTYKDAKIYKSYLVKIDNETKECDNKTELLLYLKEMV